MQACGFPLWEFLSIPSIQATCRLREAADISGPLAYPGLDPWGGSVHFRRVLTAATEAPNCKQTRRLQGLLREPLTEAESLDGSEVGLYSYAVFYRLPGWYHDVHARSAHTHTQTHSNENCWMRLLTFGGVSIVEALAVVLSLAS